MKKALRRILWELFESTSFRECFIGGSSVVRFLTATNYRGDFFTSRVRSQNGWVHVEDKN